MNFNVFSKILKYGKRKRCTPTVFTGSCEICDGYVLTVYSPWGYMWRNHRGPFCSLRCLGVSRNRGGTIDSNGYIITYYDSKPYKVHRRIMNCPKNKVVHHINHLRSDNRKENLIVVSPSENHRLNGAIWKYIRKYISHRDIAKYTRMALKDIRNE